MNLAVKCLEDYLESLPFISLTSLFCLHISEGFRSKFKFFQTMIFFFMLIWKFFKYLTYFLLWFPRNTLSSQSADTCCRSFTREIYYWLRDGKKGNEEMCRMKDLMMVNLDKTKKMDVSTYTAMSACRRGTSCSVMIWILYTIRWMEMVCFLYMTLLQPVSTWARRVGHSGGFKSGTMRSWYPLYHTLSFRRTVRSSWLKGLESRYSATPKNRKMVESGKLQSRCPSVSGLELF